MKRAVPAAVLSVSVLALSGCAPTDPYARDGQWQPAGVVQGNLAAMVAEKRDLIAGHADPAAVHTANQAVDRLWTDHPKPLLDSSEKDGAQSPQPSTPGGS